MKRRTAGYPNQRKDEPSVVVGLGGFHSRRTQKKKPKDYEWTSRRIKSCFFATLCSLAIIFFVCCRSRAAVLAVFGRLPFFDWLSVRLSSATDYRNQLGPALSVNCTVHVSHLAQPLACRPDQQIKRLIQRSNELAMKIEKEKRNTANLILWWIGKKPKHTLAYAHGGAANTIVEAEPRGSQRP